MLQYSAQCVLNKCEKKIDAFSSIISAQKISGHSGRIPYPLKIQKSFIYEREGFKPTKSLWYLDCQLTESGCSYFTVKTKKDKISAGQTLIGPSRLLTYVEVCRRQACLIQAHRSVNPGGNILNIKDTCYG